MHTLSRLASLTLSIVLLAPACASDADQPSSRIRLEAAGGDCDDPQQVCLEMHPPQCFDVCPGDDPGDDGDDCVSSDDSDLVTCGDDTCVIGTDDDGQETVVCPGSDCTVSYDVETGEETISCPPNPGDDDDGGGSEPGNPGTGG
jgi:hypothetical protein